MATINDLIPSVVKLLGNRSDVAALAPEDIGNAIRELTDNYPFEELRITGPTVQFTAGQNQYSPSFFQAPPVTGNTYTLNKVVSWFFYLQAPISFTGGGGIGAANPGYELVFRDIEDLEVLINTLNLPQYWSWLGQYLYVAGVPNMSYYTYMRYQWLHPFSTPIALSTDPIFIPYTWYDITEYAAAERIALKLRMQDVADRYHKILFGDPEFERSSGARGNPGLIFRRTSQTQKNQSRTTRSVRIMRGRY